MQRFLLLVLLLGSVGVGLWLWLLRGPDTVPMVSLVPATPIHRNDPAASATAGIGKPAPGATSVTPANPADAVERSDTTRQPDAPLPGVVEVLVVDSANMPLDEVAVVLVALPNAPLDEFRDLQTTGANGTARFTVPAGPGRSIQVWSAVGGEATANLPTALPIGSVFPLVLKLQPRCWVEGSVVDSSGQGIADAELMFLPWEDRGGPSLPSALQVGCSRADGSFRIGLAYGGRIGAVHREFSPSEMALVQPGVDRTQPPKTVSLQLRMLTRQARARGIVVDTTGAPVPGARLEFGAKTRRNGELAAAPQRTGTDRDGRFEVRHLRPGENTWAVRASGFGGTRGTFTTAAGETAELRIEVDVAAAIQGTVTNPDGIPVANAVVRAGPEPTFELDPTTTAADGSYLLRGLPGRQVEVRASRGAAQDNASLALRGGEVAIWNPVLGGLGQVASPKLTGTVVDSAGKPLPGWRALWTRSRTPGTQTVTDAEGRFALTVRGPEPIEIRVYAPDQAVGTFPAVYRTAVDPGAPLQPIVVDKAGTATVIGTVQSATQAPLAARVSMWHQELECWAEVVAGNDGRFRFDWVPPGTVDIDLVHPGHAGISRPGQTIVAGARQNLGILTLGYAVTVHGTVTGPDGQPPAQLQIHLWVGNQRLVAEYAAGSYSIASVPPGQHRMQVQGPGIAGQAFAIEVGTAPEQQQDFRVEAGVSRRIEVQSSAAAGEQVSLLLREVGGDKPHQWSASQPRREGEPAGFQACMKPGTYEAMAWGAKGWNAQTTILFAAGDDSVVTLRLARR